MVISSDSTPLILEICRSVNNTKNTNGSKLWLRNTLGVMFERKVIDPIVIQSRLLVSELQLKMEIGVNEHIMY